jgi:hypothetical protein
MAKNYKAENKAYQRGIAKQLDISDRASKNIQPDNMRSVQIMEDNHFQQKNSSLVLNN